MPLAFLWGKQKGSPCQARVLAPSSDLTNSVSKLDQSSGPCLAEHHFATCRDLSRQRWLYNCINHATGPDMRNPPDLPTRTSKENGDIPVVLKVPHWWEAHCKPYLLLYFFFYMLIVHIYIYMCIYIYICKCPQNHPSSLRNAQAFLDFTIRSSSNSKYAPRVFGVFRFQP